MFVSPVRYYKERPILYILHTYEFRINIRSPTIVQIILSVRIIQIILFSK